MAQTRKKISPENAEPSRLQLEKLYGLMAEIKKLEPWNELWDMDLIFIYLPDLKEPIACSVMGRGGECYGIGVYPGYDCISGLFRMADSAEEGFFNTLSYMDCINCYFGGRDELEPPERKLLKEMGLVFRGKNGWPYFRRSKPERMPWSISSVDAAILEKTLEQFIAAYKKYIEDDDLTVDFENDDVLCRRYAPETQTWTTQSMPMPPIPESRYQIIIKNEILTASLKAKKQNGKRLEAELITFPFPVEAGTREAPYLCRMALLADADKKIIIAQRTIDPGEDSLNIMINVLSDYIKEHGRPKTLFVRDAWTGDLYDDFCAKVGIDLDTENGVPTIDNIANEMLDQFSLMSGADA